MHRIILMSITFMMLMVATIPPVKVKAQALAEFSLTLPILLVAVGPNEIAEIHWLRQANQGGPQAPIFQPGETVHFTIVVTNTGDTTCRETIQAQVEVQPDQINTLTLAKNGASLRINGEETFLSVACLINNVIRVAYQIGVPARFKKAEFLFKSVV